MLHDNGLTLDDLLKTYVNKKVTKNTMNEIFPEQTFGYGKAQKAVKKEKK